MRAKKNLLASYLFIILNIIINLAVVRLTVNHYGEQIFAFVALAFSFITYAESFNMGVYLSTRTQIPMRGRNASVLTISSFKYLVKISLCLLAVFLLLYLPFGEQFIGMITNETDLNILKIGQKLIFISVIYSLLKIPFSLVLSAFAGHDLVDVEKKYHGLQQIVKIASLLVAVKFELNVIFYFMTFTILSLLALGCANYHYYRQFIFLNKRKLFRYSKKISSGYITLRSFKFFIFTIASVVVWSTDTLLVSIFFNPKLVTDYQINFSIFNAAFLFITAVAGALIASYGNLIRDKEHEKLNSLLNLSIYITFVFGLLITFGGVLFSKEIIELWVGEGHFISIKLILAFAMFGLTLSFSSVTNTVLTLFANSRTIMGMALSEALINLCLSIVCLKFLGVEGIAISTSISAIVSVVIPGIYVLSRHFKGKVFVQFFPIFMQFVVCCLFIFISLRLGISNLWIKIGAFSIYVLVVTLFTFILRRRYLWHLLQFIKSSRKRREFLGQDS